MLFSCVLKMLRLIQCQW